MSSFTVQCSYFCWAGISLCIELSSILSTASVFFLKFFKVSFPKIFQLIKIFHIHRGWISDSYLPASPIISRIKVSPKLPVKWGQWYMVCRYVCVCMCVYSMKILRKCTQLPALSTQNTFIFNHVLSLHRIIISEPYADMTFIIQISA